MARTLTQDITKIVGALGRVFKEEGRTDMARLVSEAHIGFEQTSFDNWNGGTYGYTLQLEVPAHIYARLKDSHEELESELRSRIERLTRLYPNEHVESVLIAPTLEEGPEQTGTDVPSLAPSFWTEGSLRLFVSHVSAIEKKALALARNLSPYGVCGFVAHRDIAPTKEWEDEIRLALATCDSLICLLTEGFNQSGWTDQEVGFAMGRGILVVPILLGLKPYGFMGRYQGYHGIGKKPSEVAHDLAEIMAKHRLTRVRMTESLVSMFENSTSFKAAKDAAQHLSLVQEWSDPLVARVRRAVRDNGQISGARGVPEIIERVLQGVYQAQWAGRT